MRATSPLVGLHATYIDRHAIETLQARCSPPALVSRNSHDDCYDLPVYADRLIPFESQFLLAAVPKASLGPLERPRGCCGECRKKAARRWRIKGLFARCLQVIEKSMPNSRRFDRIKPCALIRNSSSYGTDISFARSSMKSKSCRGHAPVR